MSERGRERPCLKGVGQKASKRRQIHLKEEEVVLNKSRRVAAKTPASGKKISRTLGFIGQERSHVGEEGKIRL